MNIHTRNLQILVAEMFKVKTGKLPSKMHEIFQIDDFDNYNLWKNREFKPGNPKTVFYGIETISVLVPKLWMILPDEYKNSTSLKELKLRLRIGCL